ncbi:uncharacterized protein LOC143289623 [Babylonia areolata]|uniref:uncharacterized protein LOC143289623 n=1 Tax=Babylonia areolata TaxID=304850 RepID=UPI003FCF18C7
MGVDINTRKTLTLDRPACRRKITTRARAAEDRRINKTQRKRAVHKADQTARDGIPENILPVGKGVPACEPARDKANGWALPMQIYPQSKKQYILIHNTTYPEAIALKDIKAETVADALWEMWTRLGVPDQIITDQGKQFTGQLVKGGNEFLKIKHNMTAPFHPQSNGLVEKFNGTLKSMLRKLAIEQPKKWNTFIPALLFAYREAPQESTGISPFEIIYGKKVKGPVLILHETWTQEEMTGEVQTSAQYVVDLRNKIEETYLRGLNNVIVFDREPITDVKHLFQSLGKAKYFSKLDLTKGYWAILINEEDRDKTAFTTLKDPTKKMHPEKIQWNKEVQSGFKTLKEKICSKLILYMPDYEKEFVLRTDAADKAIGALLLQEQEDVLKPVALPELLPRDRQSLTLRQLRQAWFTRKCFAVVFPSKKQYILIHNTTYPEAIALKDIKAETVADALWEMWTRLGVPDQIITDQGKQFTGQLVKGGNEFLKIKHNMTAPFHPQSNGLVEKFNGTLKSMLRKLAIEQPKKWNTFIPALLFAYREAPQESTGISPFEIIYGKKVKGPVLILHETWTQEEMTGEVQTSAQYVVDLRNKIEETYLRGLNNVIVFDREPITDVKHLFQSLGKAKYFSKLDLTKGYWAILINEEDRDKTAFTTLKAYLPAKPSKCFFGYPELPYLGHEVGNGKRWPEVDKIEKVRKAVLLRTKKELRSFLNLCGFYRAYIKKYSEIATPLTDPTKKMHPEKIQWNKEVQSGFKTLKEKICSKLILYMPDYEKEFVLRTDAADKAIGALLLQEQEDVLKPVAHQSRKLNGAETRYSTVKKECLATVWGISEFERLLPRDRQSLTLRQLRQAWFTMSTNQTHKWVKYKEVIPKVEQVEEETSPNGCNGG